MFSNGVLIHAFAFVFLLGFGASEQAVAGECSLKYPLISVTANAREFSRNEVFNLRFELDKAYRKKHKSKHISLYILARAGQDADKAIILNNRDTQSKPLTATQLVQRATTHKYQAWENDDRGVSLNDNRYSTSVVKNYLRTNFAKPNGQDKMIYSHAGFQYESNFGCFPSDARGLVAGGWCMQHMLKPCLDEDVPDLDIYADYSVPHVWHDSPVGFFADDPKQLWTQIVVPIEWLQDSLIEVLKDENQFLKGISNHYNILSKWDNSHKNDRNWRELSIAKINKKEDEQNSNGWVLETIAVAAAKHFGFSIQNRADIVGFLKKTNYAPSLMMMESDLAGTYSQMGALPLLNKIMPDIIIRRDEQPELGFYHMAEIVTVNSIVEWLEVNGWLESLNGSTKHEAKRDDALDFRKYEKFPMAKKIDEFFVATVKECRAGAVAKVQMGEIEAEFAKGPTDRFGKPMSRIEVFNGHVDSCVEPKLDSFIKQNGGAMNYVNKR